jgi:hypothetical protein
MSLFLYFAISGTFLLLKLMGDFYRVIILSQEASREVEANEISHEAQKSLGGATHCPGRATKARLALVRLLISVFYGCLHFDERGTPYFFHNFLRQRQRRNPSFTSRRADLLPRPSSPPTPPWRRGSISITSSSSQHQHHLHLKIRHHPPHKQ